MPALTATSKEITVFGNKRVMLALLGAITDGDTLASGLAVVDFVVAQITDAAAAADALTVTAVTSGTLTFGVVGTISGAYVLAIGT